MKPTFNWKAGMQLLIFFVILYSGFIYLTFINEPSGGWKGSLHNIRYPIVVLTPPVMIYEVIKKFRGR
jgi:hypothetical protein